MLDSTSGCPTHLKAGPHPTLTQLGNFPCRKRPIPIEAKQGGDDCLVDAPDPREASVFGVGEDLIDLGGGRSL